MSSCALAGEKGAGEKGAGAADETGKVIAPSPEKFAKVCLEVQKNRLKTALGSLVLSSATLAHKTLTLAITEK